MLDSGGGFMITWVCLATESNAIYVTISFRLGFHTLAREAYLCSRFSSFKSSYETHVSFASISDHLIYAALVLLRIAVITPTLPCMIRLYARIVGSM